MTTNTKQYKQIKNKIMPKEEFIYLKKFLIYVGSILGFIVILFIGSVGWYMNDQKDTVDKMYEVVIYNKVNGDVREAGIKINKEDISSLKEGYTGHDGRIVSLENKDKEFEATLKRNNIR